MPKTFYTERDIEDLLKKGVKSLIVDDDVVLTDLAYEKARKLGLELLRAVDQPPAAPVRPYIAKPVADASKAASSSGTVTLSAPSGDDLHQRVYKASLARLGDSVDPKLLDVIIRRVLSSINTK